MGLAPESGSVSPMWQELRGAETYILKTNIFVDGIALSSGGYCFQIAKVRSKVVKGITLFRILPIPNPDQRPAPTFQLKQVYHNGRPFPLIAFLLIKACVCRMRLKIMSCASSSHPKTPKSNTCSHEFHKTS